MAKALTRVMYRERFDLEGSVALGFTLYDLSKMKYATHADVLIAGSPHCVFEINSRGWEYRIQHGARASDRS